MLPKHARVTTPLFKEVMARGKKRYGQYVSLRFLRAAEAKFSVVVPTSVEKKAVARNTLRRRVRALLTNKQLPRVHGIIFLKKDARTATMAALRADIAEVFAQLHK